MSSGIKGVKDIKSALVEIIQGSKTIPEKKKTLLLERLQSSLTEIPRTQTSLNQVIYFLKLLEFEIQRYKAEQLNKVEHLEKPKVGRPNRM